MMLINCLHLNVICARKGEIDKQAIVYPSEVHIIPKLIDLLLTQRIHRL